MKLFGRNIPLIYWNLAAFVLGCLAGLALYKFGLTHSAALDKIIAVVSPFGNVLVNMLKMIVIPIIFFSLVCGAATMPAKSFGKMGAGVCGWYFFTSLYAAVFGTVVAIIFNPPLLQNNFTLPLQVLQFRFDLRHSLYPLNNFKP